MSTEAKPKSVGPEVAFRPRQNWPSHVTRLLDGTVIFVNPHDFTKYAFGSLDLLSLLWDRIIVDSPRQGTFVETTYQPKQIQHQYPLDRFLSMVERGIFIPYDWQAAVDDRHSGGSGAYWKRGPFQRIIDSGNYIIREEITRSTKFYDYFNPLVDQDNKDLRFEEVVKTNISNMPLDQGNLNLRPGSLNEVKNRFALAVNWEGGLAQALGADMFIHPSTKPVWQYKAAKIVRRQDELKLALDLQSFIDRLRIDLPTQMDVDEIEDFRSTSEATNFRGWLAKAFMSAREQTVPVPVPVEERVYHEFVKLCEFHRRRNESFSGYISSLVSTVISGGIGLAVAGPIGAVVSGAVGFGMGEGLKKPVTASARWLKRKIGGDWTLFFAEQIDNRP